MVTRLWAEQSEVQILAGARYFFLHIFQTGSGAYLPSHSLVPGGHFPSDTVARV